MAKVSVIITRQTMASGVAYPVSKGPVELSSKDAAALIAMGKAVAYVAKPEPVKVFTTEPEEVTAEIEPDTGAEDVSPGPQPEIEIAPQKRSYRRRRKG